MNLQLRNVTFVRNDNQLFDPMDVTIHAGELWQVMGANGSGKSTLLRIIAGLNLEFEGKILWHGVTIQKNLEDYQSHIIYLGHLNGLRVSLTILENIQFWLLHHKIDISEKKLEYLLKSFCLWEKRCNKCYQLSAGQKRKTALLRFMIQPALLWILDEPLSALDRESSIIFQQWCFDYLRSGGKIIMATHQPWTNSNYPGGSIFLSTCDKD